MSRYDALVVGGGLAGLAAAVAVAGSGLTTLHLAPKAPPDRRTSALMRPAVDYLRGAGLIGDPATLGVPLTEIRIIDATPRLLRAPETLFAASEAGLDAFGWNFANARLTDAFAAAAAGLPNLETREASLASLDGTAAGLSSGETVEASLVVGADGKKSAVRASTPIRVREREFAEAALVADLELERPLGGTSVEFHYSRGPFTLVPAGGNRANLVWIDTREALDEAKGAAPDAFNAILRARAKNLLGRITAVTPAFIFPLSTLTVATAAADNAVLVGEAAHAFPPIGAQGLNLSLRDVADLAPALASTDRAGDWPQRVAADYAARRAADLGRTGLVVDTLFRSLLSDFLPAQALRAGGLWALKTIPPLRRKAFSVGMGMR